MWSLRGHYLLTSDLDFFPTYPQTILRVFLHFACLLGDVSCHSFIERSSRIEHIYTGFSWYSQSFIVQVPVLGRSIQPS